MNHLLRDFAPVTDEAWRSVEDEARRTLAHFLTARRLVDFEGPLGWDHDAVPSRRTIDLPDSHKGVRVRSRVPYPLLELRADFDLPRATLDALARGAADADLRPVQDAARQLALAEDTIALGDGSIIDGPESARSPRMRRFPSTRTRGTSRTPSLRDRDPARCGDRRSVRGGAGLEHVHRRDGDHGEGRLSGA